MNIASNTSTKTFASLAEWRVEAAAIIALAFPLALTQLSHIAMVTTDVVMMGWLGPKTPAAGTLANHYYWFFEMGSMGLVGSVAAILAQHLGARRYRGVRRTVRQGFWVAAMVAVPCLLAIWHVRGVLRLLGQDPELSAMAEVYLRHMMAGFLPGVCAATACWGAFGSPIGHSFGKLSWSVCPLASPCCRKSGCSLPPPC